MKRSLLKQLLLMVGLFVAVSPDAVAVVSGGINYEITSDSTVCVITPISSRRPYKGDVVIPTEVAILGKTYKVTAIGAEAFRECRELTSIEIPNSVVEIGAVAFEDCSSLTSVEIPNSIVEIKSGTFRYCSALASVVIPNSVFVIGDEAFHQSGLTTVTIGENVQSIGQGAFLYCNSLWVVNSLNPTPPVIKENTFNYISYLYVPLGSKAAYEQDFYWRNFFDNIDEIEEFGDHIDGLMEADFELDGIYYNIANDGSAAVVTYKNRNYNSYSGDVVIPAKVTYNNVEYSVSYIGFDAFRECGELTSIEIPEGVTTINDNAFRNCSSLASIEIPSSVKSVGAGAFSNCSNLATVIIGENVEGIDYFAFYSCTSLTSIEIPSSVKYIGASAFSNCSNLTTVTIGENVEEIGQGAFGYCLKLAEINSLNPVPPVIEDYDDNSGMYGDAFVGITKDNCVLNVPLGSRVVYVQADYWKDFLNINEKNFGDTSGVDNIAVGFEPTDVEWYNLQGAKVVNPQNGVYIRVQNGVATKHYVK